MERLEPILKQKFWILLGVGILMTITGWWMATGSLAATIKLRTDEVTAAFKMIPSGEIPNDKWSAQLAARNAEQERAVRYTKALLWERQLSRMTWPDEVRQHVWQNGYRGEIGLEGREEYRTAYAREVRRVWESVLPFRPTDGTGIVAFGADQKVLPQRTWGMSAPASAEMWDAQEDLWLLESLLRTIVDVNGGPTAQRGDASIHVIETLKLMGGQPPSQRKSAASPAAAGAAVTGGMSAPPSGAHGGGAASAGGFGGGAGGGAGGMGAGGAGQTAALGSADFDPKEEIGSDGSAGAGGAGAGGVAGGMGKMGPSAAHGSGPAAGGGAGAGGASSAIRRYVEDDPTLPYKSRAFYITVLMDHRKIPSLVAELSASEKSAWPVEIIRIQMVRLHDNDIDSRGGGGAGPGRGGGFSPMAGPTAGRVGMPSPGTTRSTGFSLDNDDDPMREGANNPNAASQASGAAAALESALQDPFIARVAICGIITLYNPVKPEPAAAAVPQPVPVVPAAGTPAQASPVVPADPATTTNPAAPADSATPAPVAVPTDGNPTPIKPEVPGEAPPAKPTTPADPAVPAALPDAPKTPAPTGNR